MKRIYGVLFLFFSQAVFSSDEAEQIFAELTPSLYQIKLIDNASGEKSSIGSGFQISANGVIATNYHVISNYALHPEKYTIEYLDHQGSSAQVSLISVDVINDLALIKREVESDMPFFELATHNPIKGEKLFSLGNPHDLGMIVVPGTYNGLKKESFNERIHFTGSINSGMSGGPVVNNNEEVVGINVATSGNQIGFLVPLDKLVTLFNNYKTAPPETIKLQMAEQLYANQNTLMNELLNNIWENKELANKVNIPIIDVPFIRCWGDSNADKTDVLILAAVAKCSLDERTYISSLFFTGNIEIEYKYMLANDLSDLKFYHLYQKQISKAGAGNKAQKEDVTEFQCHHDLVSPNLVIPQVAIENDSAINNKSIFCVRAYKDYPDLFDALYLGATIDHNQQALVSHFTLAGVNKENALAFARKFITSVAWK